METIKKEKSCGAVVYREINNQIEVLMIKQLKGHWAIPKGHVEGNETEVETAIREVKEETNIDVEIDTSFCEKMKYPPKEGVIKDVIIFKGLALNYDVKIQKEEVIEYKWATKDEAINLITYENSRNLLINFFNYMNGDNNE